MIRVQGAGSVELRPCKLEILNPKQSQAPGSSHCLLLRKAASVDHLVCLCVCEGEKECDISSASTVRGLVRRLYCFSSSVIHSGLQIDSEKLKISR